MPLVYICARSSIDIRSTETRHLAACSLAKPRAVDIRLRTLVLVGRGRGGPRPTTFVRAGESNVRVKL